MRCSAAGATQLFFFGLDRDRARRRPAEAEHQRHRRASSIPEGGSRRDAGFSIFYMGINTGAFLGSISCRSPPRRYGWSAGFALPAVGMAARPRAVRS